LVAQNNIFKHLARWVEPKVSANTLAIENILKHLGEWVEPRIIGIGLHIRNVIERRLDAHTVSLNNIFKHLAEWVEPKVIANTVAIENILKHLGEWVEPRITSHARSLSNIFTHLRVSVNPAVAWVNHVGKDVAKLFYGYALPQIKNFERILPVLQRGVSTLSERIRVLPSEVLERVYERVLSDTKARPFEWAREIVDSMVEVFTPERVAELERYEALSDIKTTEAESAATIAGAPPPIFGIMGITYDDILKGLGERVMDP